MICKCENECLKNSMKICDVFPTHYGGLHINELIHTKNCEICLIPKKQLVKANFDFKKLCEYTWLFPAHYGNSHKIFFKKYLRCSVTPDLWANTHDKLKNLCNF